MNIYRYIYIHTHTHTNTYKYIYTHTEIYMFSSPRFAKYVMIRLWVFVHVKTKYWTLLISVLIAENT